MEAPAWDNKLTLEFSNSEPKVDSIAIEKVDVPTIYIAGDSTSTDQPREPFNSWGQMLTRFSNRRLRSPITASPANRSKVSSAETPGQSRQHHQTGRLAVHPNGTQRPEGKG